MFCTASFVNQATRVAATTKIELFFTFSFLSSPFLSLYTRESTIAVSLCCHHEPSLSVWNIFVILANEITLKESCARFRCCVKPHQNSRDRRCFRRLLDIFKTSNYHYSPPNYYYHWTSFVHSVSCFNSGESRFWDLNFRLLRCAQVTPLTLMTSYKTHNEPY